MSDIVSHEATTKRMKATATARNETREGKVVGDSSTGVAERAEANARTRQEEETLETSSAHEETDESKKLYAGLWTPEEKEYATALLEEFRDGNLPGIPEGTTLRGFLADKCKCATKRISKRYESSGYNGRLQYRPKTRTLSKEESERRLKKLGELEKKFWESRKLAILSAKPRKKKPTKQSNPRTTGQQGKTRRSAPNSTTRHLGQTAQGPTPGTSGGRGLEAGLRLSSSAAVAGPPGLGVNPFYGLPMSNAGLAGGPGLPGMYNNMGLAALYNPNLQSEMAMLHAAQLASARQANVASLMANNHNMFGSGLYPGRPHPYLDLVGGPGVAGAPQQLVSLQQLHQQQQFAGTMGGGFGAPLSSPRLGPIGNTSFNSHTTHTAAESSEAAHTSRVFDSSSPLSSMTEEQRKRLIISSFYDQAAKRARGDP